MSVSTPILTLICWALVAPQANMMARDAKLIVRFIAVSPSFRALRHLLLYSEIIVQLLDIGVQFAGGELIDDTPIFHDVVTVRDGRREAEILLDQEDGEPLFLQRADGLADLLDDDGGETLGRLIEQQQPRAGAQDAADGEHLLFAAGELGALAGAEPFIEIGKQFEDTLERKPARP